MQRSNTNCKSSNCTFNSDKNTTNCHNNMPQEVSPSPDAVRIVRPTPTTPAPAVLAHFGGSVSGPHSTMVPMTMPQGPPVIHRGPGPLQASTIFTLYVPATAAHHQGAVPHTFHHHYAHPALAVHRPAPSPTLSTAAIVPTMAGTISPPSHHMVPTSGQRDGTVSAVMARTGDSNVVLPTMPPRRSSSSSSATSPSKVYATPEPSTSSTSSDDESATTTKQANRSASDSFDSQHAAAHSVLLLASGGPAKPISSDTPEKRNSPTSPTNETNTAPEGAVSSSNVPFKKRKMVSEIWLRRAKQPKQEGGAEDEENSSFHVSPVSHGSKSTGTTSWSPDRSQASNGSSYVDEQLVIKGGQALPETAKITDDKTIAGVAATPPTTVTTVRHFPSTLYDLLDQASGEHNQVLQWCSNGKAWRIVRWDTLRKSVLPEHFGGASVDLFLSEISAWGFTEIINGSDAGAYAHTLFRRGFPNLCKEIRRLREINPPSNNVPRDEENVRSNAGTPSILQVPSLGDAAGNPTEEDDRHPKSHQLDNSSITGSSGKHSSSQSPSTPTRLNKKCDEVFVAMSASAPTVSTATPPSTWPFHPQPVVYIPYRQQEDHFFDQRHQFQPHSYLQTTWTPVHPEAPPYATSFPAYSPVRVRSGRGAARLPAQHYSAQYPATVTPNSSSSRRSVASHGARNSGGNTSNKDGYRVVSNRGRRSGSVAIMTSNALSRMALPSTTTSPSYTSSASSTDATITSSAPTMPSTAASSPLRSAMKQRSQVSPQRKGSPVVSFPSATSSSGTPQCPSQSTLSATRSSPAMRGSGSPVLSSQLPAPAASQ